VLKAAVAPKVVAEQPVAVEPLVARRMAEDLQVVAAVRADIQPLAVAARADHKVDRAAVPKVAAADLRAVADLQAVAAVR
jgi:hypothetical protein